MEMVTKLRELIPNSETARQIATQLSLDFNLPFSAQAVRSKAKAIGVRIRREPDVRQEKVGKQALTRTIQVDRKGKDFWTPQRNEQLLSYIRQGLTYSEIAYKMGRDRTRIRSRYRFMCEQENGDVWKRAAKERSENVRQITREKNMKAKRRHKEAEKAPALIFYNKAARKVNLMDLRNDWCHMPFGDPRTDAFRYCGADVPETSPRPYCEECFKRLYVAPKPPIKKFYR